MALRLQIRFILAAMILFLPPGPVFAHLVNTDVGEFYGGMVHPLTSAEHLLPILALGLLAGQCGRRAARWTLMLFPLFLMAGIWIGSRYPGAGFAQFVNLALLAVLGGLLAFAQRVPDGVVAGAAVATGMVLGYRSGVDMAAAGVGFQFIPGVVLTGLIIIALLAAWVPEADGRFSRTLRAGMGAGLSLAGGVMALAVFTGLGWNAIRGVGFPSGADLLSMVRGGEISVSMVAASLAGSAFWGAGHALTPGHGKAIVAAYLVGARSTPWHAVYLGLTVTATHTLTIFALG
ncbi:MAG: HupE/UreJ family protein, partial [Desulfobacterales bacterium]